MCGLGGRTVSVCLFRHSDHLGDMETKEDDKENLSSSTKETLLTVPFTQRYPLNKSRTVDHSNDSSPQSVLKKAIRRAEVAIRMKSLE